MSKTKKERVEPDFRLNPDNIKVNDWVFRNGDIGFVEGVAQDTESMLRFWVRWNNDSSPISELPEHLKKLNRPVAVGDINYTIDLDLLVLSPELQQRVKLDKSVVEEYCEAFKNHVKFPPITIWYLTDEEYKGDPLFEPAYLIDGFHRYEGAIMAGIKELPFIRKQGTLREAILYSTSINSSHGVRRSNEDKRKSVLTLLNDEEWSQWSNRAIANQCHVSSTFVDKLRKKIDTISENDELSANVCTLSKKDDIILGDGMRKYIKNGKEFIMSVKDALNDPEIFPELPGTPLLDLPGNSPDAEDNNHQPTNDNTIYPEDAIKNLDDVFDSEEDTLEIHPSMSEEEEIIKPKNSKAINKPKKKEIYIQEGLNYYAGKGDRLRWYLQVRKHIYEGLKIYQDKVEAIGIERILSDFLKEKGILKTHPDDCTIALEYSDEPSPINSLDLEKRNKLEAIVSKHGIEKILSDYE